MIAPYAAGPLAAYLAITPPWKTAMLILLRNGHELKGVTIDVTTAPDIIVVPQRLDAYVRDWNVDEETPHYRLATTLNVEVE